MRALLLLSCLLPSVALAHLNGVPTTARPTTPEGVGEVVDRSFTLRWTDYDEAATTGQTSIDWYATTQMPPTFRPGVVPEALDGIVIALGIEEQDRANELVWDTSAVPPGSYVLFSIANDPPFRMVAFSRGVVTVAHEGDPVHPAIAVVEPDGQRDVTDATYRIGFEVFDPDASGTVRVEAMIERDGELFLLGEVLPQAGGFDWDTRAVPEGDYAIRATVTDARGLSHAAFGRSFVRVDRPGGAGGVGGEGAGGRGGSGGAAGAVGTGGGGGVAAPSPSGAPERSGCGCTARSEGSGAGTIALLLCVAALQSRRRA